MDLETVQLRRIATRLGVCVSLTVDPAATARERWVASVGLDALGAGPTPRSALRSALLDLAPGSLAEAGDPGQARRAAGR